VARLVSAATVEARLDVEPAVEFEAALVLAAVLAAVDAAEAALDALKRLYRAED
jgi:NO-binding membrane sensor protein with MHYT domain